MANIVRISSFLFVSAVLFMVDPSAEDIRCVRTIEGDNAMQTDAEFKEVNAFFGFSKGKKAKYCHEKVLRTAKACATQVCLKRDASKLIIWKDCVDSMDFCNGSGINTAECEKHNLQHQCLACEGDYCNAKLRFNFVEPVECWTTSESGDGSNNNWVPAKSEKESVGKGAVRCRDNAPFCTKMTCSDTGEKGYMIAKGCGQMDYCSSSAAKKEEDRCKNEFGGGKFHCATPCNENNCNSDFACMSNHGEGTNDYFGFKNVPRSDRNMSIGKEVLCGSKYCGMQVCTSRNGKGYAVRNHCVDRDFCEKKERSKDVRYCERQDADYDCRTCEEEKCNARKPEAKKVRKCWSTEPEGVDAQSEAENVGRENEKCEDYQPLCITKTCITKVSNVEKIKITKGCGRKDYCKSEDYEKAKKECEGDGKEKKGEFSCTQCGMDNCNIYRKCWKTQYDKNFDFVEVEDSNPYSRMVFDKDGHTCNQTDVCFTEICKAGQGKLMVRRGCAQPGYCKQQEHLRFCNRHFSAVGGSHHECRECRDNDHCNGPWDPPAPAPAEPQESSAGTNLKGHHMTVMMLWTWMASMFVTFLALC